MNIVKKNVGVIFYVSPFLFYFLLYHSKNKTSANILFFVLELEKMEPFYYFWQLQRGRKALAYKYNVPTYIFQKPMKILD